MGSSWWCLHQPPTTGVVLHLPLLGVLIPTARAEVLIPTSRAEVLIPRRKTGRNGLENTCIWTNTSMRSGSAIGMWTAPTAATRWTAQPGTAVAAAGGLVAAALVTLAAAVAGTLVTLAAAGTAAT